MNVIIYTGPGAITPSATHNLETLRRLLFPHYAVATLDTEALLRQPWSGSCALLVLPEGYENKYTKALGIKGRAEICKYMNNGGKLLALGDGVALAREEEPRAGLLEGSWTIVSEDEEQKSWTTLGTEGKLFRLKKAVENMDPGSLDQNKTEIIRTFVDQDGFGIEGRRERNAILYKTVTSGAVILAGVELSAAVLGPTGDNSVEVLTKNLEAVKLTCTKKEELLRLYIEKLGMKLNYGEDEDLQLSVIHISSITPSNAQKLRDSCQDLIQLKDEIEYIVDINDTFHIETITAERSISMNDKKNESLLTIGLSRGNDLSILIHTQDYPLSKETPFFDHNEFYSSLRQHRSTSSQRLDSFGSYLMYGHVMTSTNTILESNQKLLHRLPTGFTALATRQTQGRGRSSNVWLSPAGCLLFSVCIRHPVNLIQQAHPLFIQYIASMAVVQAVKSYGEGYNEIPIRLKWPNDIYVEDPSTLGQNKFVKIGGILVQCNGDGKEYYLVAGIGFNLNNVAPTTSINQVLEALNHRRNSIGQESLRPYTQETLLAHILAAFEEFHSRFCSNGWDNYLEGFYHKYWLHSNQIVTLETIEGAPRARILGITRDWAYLRAEEVDDQSHGTGKMHDLQPDGNSFDFWKGLVKRKE